MAIEPGETGSPFRTREERKSDRLQKREAVLRAAVRMFNVRGFHATSLDDVASTLGISKPTIYHYLGNKDQVLMECVTRGLEELREAVEVARSLPETGLDRLRSFLRQYAKINMDDFGRCVIRTGDEALRPKSAARFRALKGEIDKAMRAIIEEGIADHSIASVDVKLVAFALAGALNWPARWYQADGEKSREAVADTMVDFLTMGLKPR